MWGAGPLEVVIIFLVIALVFGPGAVLFWFLLRMTGSQNERAAEEHQPAEDRAMTVARERYAAGEITREEFEEIKATLG